MTECEQCRGDAPHDHAKGARLFPLSTSATATAANAPWMQAAKLVLVLFCLHPTLDGQACLHFNLPVCPVEPNSPSVGWETIVAQSVAKKTQMIRGPILIHPDHVTFSVCRNERVCVLVLGA